MQPVRSRAISESAFEDGQGQSQNRRACSQPREIIESHMDTQNHSFRCGSVDPVLTSHTVTIAGNKEQLEQFTFSSPATPIATSDQDAFIGFEFTPEKTPSVRRLELLNSIKIMAVDNSIQAVMKLKGELEEKLKVEQEKEDLANELVRKTTEELKAAEDKCAMEGKHENVQRVRQLSSALEIHRKKHTGQQAYHIHEVRKAEREYEAEHQRIWSEMGKYLEEEQRKYEKENKAEYELNVTMKKS